MRFQGRQLFVIPNGYEESLIFCSCGWRCFAIAQHDRHMSFRARPVVRRGISSFLLVTVAIVLSLGGRFFKAKPFRMTLLRGGLHHRIEIRRVIPLRMTRDLLGGGFFLLAVVRMTFGPFRYIRESLIGNKKVCSKSEQTFLLPMRKRSIRTR